MAESNGQPVPPLVLGPTASTGSKTVSSTDQALDTASSPPESARSQGSKFAHEVRPQTTSGDVSSEKDLSVIKNDRRLQSVNPGKKVRQSVIINQRMGGSVSSGGLSLAKLLQSDDRPDTPSSFSRSLSPARIARKANKRAGPGPVSPSDATSPESSERPPSAPTGRRRSWLMGMTSLPSSVAPEKDSTAIAIAQGTEPVPTQGAPLPSAPRPNSSSAPRRSSWLMTGVNKLSLPGSGAPDDISTAPGSGKSVAFESPPFTPSAPAPDDESITQLTHDGSRARAASAGAVRAASAPTEQGQGGNPSISRRAPKPRPNNFTTVERAIRSKEERNEGTQPMLDMSGQTLTLALPSTSVGWVPGETRGRDVQRATASTFSLKAKMCCESAPLKRLPPSVDPRYPPVVHALWKADGLQYAEYGKYPILVEGNRLSPRTSKENYLYEFRGRICSRNLPTTGNTMLAQRNKQNAKHESS
eukprot:gnl/TRDRNA2_/TRDRNA2_199955_c0_seq1.p1 gnl/TRDRNA2_/TRDRNA2_199955_c0~~gnl/TRDRNA2_/TRDRNA2_199955_c0_seq1.p1  ORF type:complete len:490 (+),score=26.58 gnl/TRDRNA2_/TRDRNA2_199955_c0_seq1:53-1471(+)